MQEYKCPCCSGAIEFNSSLQKMKCPYCETEFEMDAIKALDESAMAEQPDDMRWDSQSAEWNGYDSANMAVYSCQSCGAEIVVDNTTAASKCPYCDNNIVMSGQLSGVLRPDIIIPFKLDKKAAKAGFENHLKGKKLLPRLFKRDTHIDEIKGVYVPFWLFDTDSHANVNYLATRSEHWSDSSYNYTRTSYFNVMRSGSVSFKDIPVDGSSQMDDDLMDSIEPFDMTGATEFNSAYLAGYLADKYDVDAEQSVERANFRVKNSTEDVFRDTVEGYDTVETRSSSIRTMNGKTRYALLPVWVMNTTWNGKNFIFSMNGQTGKFVGNLPVDKSLFWSYFAKYAIGFSAIISLISYFFMI